jgi:ADP-glucose pyrophosphorylase
MTNLYLVWRNDGAQEVTADFYERKDEDWVFVLAGDEVYRIKIDEVVSIAKAPRDLPESG